MSTVLECFSVSSTDRPASPVRAAIYVRISVDRTGAGLGVARQEEDCRALCARLGWAVALVYCDNDVSAYSGKPRPQWDRLMADIAVGQIDAVTGWHIDRLTRSPRELEDVIDLHDKRGIMLATATGEIDLSTSSGRMLARMLGAAARHEAEHQAERRRRAQLQKARAGQPHKAGNRRGYGYQPDGTTIIPAEAAIIREAATRVLAGESPRSVAGDLNDRAVPSATGKKWSAAVLSQILASARVSGRREHYGEILHAESWAAIIPAGDSDQLRAQLARRPGTPRADSRRYLLSGILTCARCETGMYGRPHHNGPRYICVKDPGKAGCGKMTVTAALAEEEAADQILTALDSPEFLNALITAATGGGTDTAAISGQLRTIDARRDDLAAMWAAGDISRKEWLTARDELTANADMLTGELSRTQHGRALAQFAAMTGTVWERWDTMITGARRALIQATTASIPVHPATSHRWSPDRIGTPIWRA
jgi:site-specific DNA recombinase